MYLKKIGNTFYFCYRVPIDLTTLLGRKELKKSLKTSDRQTAKAAVKAYVLELERLGVNVRTGLLDEAQLQRILLKFKNTYLTYAEDLRENGMRI
jgi:hypothetical protein